MHRRDSRVAMLITWAAIAAGTAGLAELIVVAVRWWIDHHP